LCRALLQKRPDYGLRAPIQYVFCSSPSPCHIYGSSESVSHLWSESVSHLWIRKKELYTWHGRRHGLWKKVSFFSFMIRSRRVTLTEPYLCRVLLQTRPWMSRTQEVFYWTHYHSIYVGLFCKRDPECHELNQFSIKRAATLCSHPTNSTQFLCPVSPFSQKKRKTSPICVVVLCKWDSENQKLEEICVSVEQIETQTAACSTQSRKLEESSKRGVIL